MTFAWRRWRFLAAALAVVVPLPSAASAVPAGGMPTQAFWDGCYNVQTLVDVPKDTVEVPGPFALPNGLDSMAHLVISAFRCQSVTVGGQTEPTLVVSVEVQINEPVGVQPVGPGEFHEYLLSVATNNRALAKWFKEGTGLGITYVPGIEYFYPIGELGTGDFHVHTPAPSPSVITFEGTATAQKEFAVPVSGSWWRRDQHRVVRFATPPFKHFFTFAPQDHVTITAEGDLAALIGAQRTCSLADPASGCLFIPHHLGLFAQTKYTCGAGDLSACGPPPTE